MKRPRVIIIGAGITGLVAARELSDDYSVAILEARSHPGGRIHSAREQGFVTTIDAGPEFVHGTSEETIKLLKEAGIPVLKPEGKIYRKEKGKWKEMDEMVDGWDVLLRKMKRADEDETMDEFLQKHFSGDKYTELRRYARDYAEGFDVADTSKVSVKALYREWIESDEMSRVIGGFGKLTEYIARKCVEKGVELELGTTVKQIDHQPGEVTVYASDGRKYDGEQCIITLPVSLLQMPAGKMNINFTPPIDDYVTAARHIGFGTVIKVVLQFKDVFWQDDATFIFGREEFPTWWTQAPDTSTILTGWVGGPQAQTLSQASEETILERALVALSNMYGINIAQLRTELSASQVYNWKKNEAVLGAYSYPTPESHEARKILNKPISDTLFFAGEGLHDGADSGTVEAAIISALDAVKKVKSSRHTT